jgi:hypothetical protein
MIGNVHIEPKADFVRRESVPTGSGDRNVKKLLLILGAAVIISSCLSHAATAWLKIRATPVFLRQFGPTNGSPAFVEGSSLAFEGLDWTKISDTHGLRIQNLSALGSSPCEWEILHHQSSDAGSGFVVVSPYDLNEYWLCDFRADIVPLGETISDLRQNHTDWAFAKRILSQYPESWLRILYPTVGRSDGVMTGIRSQLEKLRPHKTAKPTEDEPLLTASGTDYVKERITDWSPGRFLRRMESMREACDGRQAFDGLKQQALLRLLQQAGTPPKVTLVVLPVSPAYQKEFLDAAVLRQFNDELDATQHANPGLRIIRLDHISELNDDSLYFDLVHLNMYGREIATTVFLTDLARRSEAP